VKVQCPNCKTIYKLAKAPASTIKTICRKCGRKIAIDPILTEQAGSQKGGHQTKRTAKPRDVLADIRMQRQERGEGAEDDLKWHEQRGVVWASLLLFFPVGLFVLWRSRRFSRKGKVAVSAILTLLVMSVMVGYPTLKGRIGTRLESEVKRVAKPGNDKKRAETYEVLQTEEDIKLVLTAKTPKESRTSKGQRARGANAAPNTEIRGTYEEMRKICEEPVLISQKPLNAYSERVQTKLGKFFDFKPLETGTSGLVWVEGKRWYTYGSGKILISHDIDDKIMQASIEMGLNSEYSERLRRQNILIVCAFLEAVVPQWPKEKSKEWVMSNSAKFIDRSKKVVGGSGSIGKREIEVGKAEIQFSYTSHPGGGTIQLDVYNKDHYYKCLDG
jgi:hypothetical protein